jgi:glucokinase
MLCDQAGGHLESITAERVMEAAEQGDALAGEVVREAADYLGIAVANLLNLFDPHMIILSGDIAAHATLFIARLVDTVRRRALSGSLNSVEIVPGLLGNRAAAIGAATLAIDRFFTLAEPFTQVAAR